MSQISRLRTAEISNGNLINADDIDVELNQLVAESNGQDSRINNLETTSMTIAGTKSFSSVIKVNEIQENSVEAGVTVEGVKLQDGTIRLEQKSSFYPGNNGEIGYNATEQAFRVLINDTSKYLLHEGNPVLYQNGITGAPPLYTASNAIGLKAGLRARNSTNATDIELANDISLSLDVSGVSGLDTGSKSANTWYYVYLVKRISNGETGAVFSATNEAGGGSIVLPTGFNLKRQLPIAIRTDASSNILPFYVSAGWPYRPMIQYRLAIMPLNVAPVAGQPNVLDGGTSNSYTDISLANFVPPISTQAILRGGVYQISSSNRYGYIRKKGSTADEFVVANLSGRTYTEYESEIIETDANQVIQYRMTDSASGMDLNVKGYIVTELS